MSSKVFFVFPHQLFEKNYSLGKEYVFYLFEEPLFFNQYNFHKQKLIFHRASMKYYLERLIELGFKVRYFEFGLLKDDFKIVDFLKEDTIEEIHYYNVEDEWLDNKVRNKYSSEYPIYKYESPMFICSEAIIKMEFGEKEHFSMLPFYISQRKRLNLLIEKGKPVGGKWSYDVENRSKFPSTSAPPEHIRIGFNSYIIEAIAYVDLHFKENVGNYELYNYAVTHEDAKKCLQNFLLNHLKFFGTYEDAISKDFPFLYHSVLSPYLNSGLLTPDQVLVELENVTNVIDIPLNSREGYIRQLIGWREFIFAVYTFKGNKIRSNNFWNHNKPLPQSFYKGTTGIEPIDAIINRVIDFSYCHHIERLMILGNFMLLCEINPDDIYRWFMEMFIDAYDWVMVPNVYSMSQYADGGSITTKPYLSSSNYVLKMSDFSKGEWCNIWDALYWRFIDIHKKFFSHNPRLSLMTSYLNKMSADQLNGYHDKAEKFLSDLFGKS